MEKDKCRQERELQNTEAIMLSARLEKRKLQRSLTAEPGTPRYVQIEKKKNPRGATRPREAIAKEWLQYHPPYRRARFRGNGHLVGKTGMGVS